MFKKLISNNFSITVSFLVYRSNLFLLLLRNFKLLSFGEEAEEDEEENVEANKKYSGRSKSTHDLLQDPNLSSLPAVDMKSNSQKGNEEASGDSNDDDRESALSGDEDVKKRGWDSGGEE